MTAVTEEPSVFWMVARRSTVIIILAGVIWGFLMARGLVGYDKIKLQTGAEFPAFSLPDVQNLDQRITLDQFRGKGVLVNFTNTQCSPCQQELKTLKQLHQRYAGEHFEMVGISVEPANLIKSYREYHKVLWHMAVDRRSLLGARVGVEATPVTVFVGPGGTVAGVIRGALSQPEAGEAVERLILLSRKAARK